MFGAADDTARAVPKAAAAAAEQKRQDAPEFADKDLEVLIENYGACDSPVMKRYAKNGGSYLKNSGRSR